MATALEQQLKSAEDVHAARMRVLNEAGVAWAAATREVIKLEDAYGPNSPQAVAARDAEETARAKVHEAQSKADFALAEVVGLRKDVADEREKAARLAAQIEEDKKNFASEKFQPPSGLSAAAEQKKRDAYMQDMGVNSFNVSNFKGMSGQTALNDTINNAFAGGFEMTDENDGIERRVTGAGGEATFWMMPLKMDGTPDDRIGKAVRFDLLPARHSFFDRQGQRVPDAGAGMTFNLLFNLAKLNIPGARPVYQQMGIAEEHIEMVGAFTGFDVSSYEETVASAYRSVPGRNAFQQAQELIEMITQGREFAIKMTTDDPEDGSFSVARASGELYKGFAKICRMVLAHEQRMYWKLVICVTNRDGDGHLDFEPAIKIPPELKAGVGGRLASAKADANPPAPAPADDPAAEATQAAQASREAAKKRVEEAQKKLDDAKKSGSTTAKGKAQIDLTNAYRAQGEVEKQQGRPKNPVTEAYDKHRNVFTPSKPISNPWGGWMNPNAGK